MNDRGMMIDQPNVIVMIADDHRFDALHLAGDPVVQTPTLDALAAGGVAFRQAHCMGGLTGAVCVPSRASLLTGTNVLCAAASRQMDDNAGLQTLNPALAVLPATLRQAGYHTYATGKWHNDKASFAASFRDGASLFFGGMSDHWRVPVYDFDPSGQYPPEHRYIADGFSSEVFAGNASRFLRDYQGAAPFFLYVAFTAPHDPRTPPGAYATRYDPATIPLPPNFLPEHPFDNGELRVRDECLAAWPRTPEIIRQHLADYYGMIEHLDAQVGQIMQALADRADAANTIVVYTADHGLAVGRHGLMGKQNLYEHSVRVPLLLRGPGLPAGREVRALTDHQDLFPTLCALTGTPIPDTVEGHNLLPLLTDEAAQGRDYVYGLYKDVQRMVSDGHWKLIRYYRSTERHTGTDRVQLFDLDHDPWEMRDCADDPRHASELRRLAGALGAWQEAVDDPLAGRPLASPTP
jgi:arylsulfatase A-like enzyme